MADTREVKSILFLIDDANPIVTLDAIIVDGCTALGYTSDSHSVTDWAHRYIKIVKD